MTALSPRTGRAAGTTTMQAVVREEYGTADRLRVSTVPIPEPSEHEVLVRVHAAGLDRGVWHVMTGKPYAARLAFGLRRPRNPVLGLDLAGTVAAVGSQVSSLAVGDEVFGFGRGTFAEYAVAREDRLAPKPRGISFEQAAVLPVSAATALQAVDLAGIEAGQTVLVTGASGGVGGYAVQLASQRGGVVTGVASTAKLDLVRSFGAAHVIDYTREDLLGRGGARYDVILDVAGNPGVVRLRRALTPTGTAVIVGGEEGGPLTGGLDRQLRALATSLVVRQRLALVIGRERSADLLRVAELVEDSTLTPTVERAYPLAEAPAAMRALEAGTVRGKLVVTC